MHRPHPLQLQAGRSRGRPPRERRPPSPRPRESQTPQTKGRRPSPMRRPRLGRGELHPSGPSCALCSWRGVLGATLASATWLRPPTPSPNCLLHPRRFERPTEDLEGFSLGERTRCTPNTSFLPQSAFVRRVVQPHPTAETRRLPHWGRGVSRLWGGRIGQRGRHG